MNTYEIGKTFPHQEYLGKGEITVAMLNEGFLDIVCVIQGINPDEKKDWKKGALWIHLFEKSNIPFLVLSFKNWELDVNINIGKVIDEKIDGWLNSKSNLINMFLIESESGHLAAMRTITIPSKMGDAIRDICEAQTSSEKDIELLIDAILNSVPTAQMKKEARLSYKVGT